MEQDNEVSGNGNSYTTHFRQYDPRIARWLSIDPEFMNFPWQSPYVAFDNNPILNNDPKGGAAENQKSGPGKRKLRLTRKISSAEIKGKVAKANRLRSRLSKLNNSSKGQFKENNGGTRPRSNSGKGQDDFGESGVPTGTSTSTPLTESGPFNQVGFKAARIDPDGNVDVFSVGSIAFFDESGDFPIAVWPTDNPYGQKAGDRVVVDDSGNILGSEGEVLIPVLKEVDYNDGLYEKGDVFSSGKEVKKDAIIRLEGVSERDASGRSVTGRGKDKRVDITDKVEGKNKY